MGDAATPTLPDFTSQTASAYKANIDAGFAVADRIAWAFAAHSQATPDMTVRVYAGAVFDGATLTEKAAQSSGTITAPTTDPRIDRVVVDRSSGAVSVITGTEAASPSPPAITGNVVPVAQVALVVSQSTIVNADITDERDLGALGLGAAAFDGVGAGLKEASGNLEVDINGLTEDTAPDTGADFMATYDASAAVLKKVLLTKVGGFVSGTLMLFQQTAAPTGWTKQTTHNDKSLRVVSGTAGSAGATAFTSVFGASKVAGAHTLTQSEMPAHTHTQQGRSTAGSGGATANRQRDDGSNNGNAGETASTGGGGSHDHTLSLDLQYVDVIIASKD